MKTKKIFIPLVVIAILSTGSMFCLLTPQTDTSTSATLAAMNSTETALAQAFIQMTQMAEGLPTNTPISTEIIPPTSTTTTDNILAIPGDITCPVVEEGSPHTVRLETAGYSLMSHHYYPYFFITSEIGFTATEPCGMLKTDDGGHTWRLLPVPTTHLIYSIYFLDPSNGWAAGEDGALLKTTNGGSSWEAVSSGVNSDLRVIKFWDIQTGWVAGNNGILRYTSDGGNSWNSGATNTQVDILDFAFSDPSNGVAIARDPIQPVSAWMETSDGGKTWEVHASYDPAPQAVTVVDGEIWIVGGWTEGKIWNFPGNTVYQNQTPATSCRYLSVDFMDTLHGWAVGGCGLATFTQDGGNNWTPMGVYENVWWTLIHFISDQEAVLAGINYEDYQYYLLVILHSSDGGNSWQE